MAVVTIYSDFRAQENEVFTVSIVSQFLSHEMMRPDVLILVFEF